MINIHLFSRCSASQSLTCESNRPQCDWTRHFLQAGAYGCSRGLLSLQVLFAERMLLIALMLIRLMFDYCFYVPMIKACILLSKLAITVIHSEEKAKLLRDVMAKIDGKNETLE